MLPHNHVPDRAVLHILAECFLITMSRIELSSIRISAIIYIMLPHNHVADGAVLHIPASYTCFSITLSRMELSCISEVIYASSSPCLRQSCQACISQLYASSSSFHVLDLHILALCFLITMSWTLWTERLMISSCDKLSTWNLLLWSTTVMNYVVRHHSSVSDV